MQIVSTRERVQRGGAEVGRTKAHRLLRADLCGLQVGRAKTITRKRERRRKRGRGVLNLRQPTGAGTQESGS